MRYLALAADYDGTLATNGVVGPDTVAALERVVTSGRKLILVTGRELDELLAIFPHIHLFERVVAENGALLYRPATREEERLATAPPPEFAAELTQRGVGPISIGRVIVATWEPHETTVLEVIKTQGLELQVIFNKGAVMVLPAGVNKASGLQAALDELGLSPHNVVAIGDAENDHALLRLAEFGTAVANAIPSLKDEADLVTRADHGAGVQELIEHLVAEDLAAWHRRLTRHQIVVGTRDVGWDFRLTPYGANVLVTGASGSGKSTLVTAIVEGLRQQRYQVCIVDPEGDYEEIQDAVVVGDAERAPTLHEVMQLLEQPHEQAVVNLVGLTLQDRPAFFTGLLARLQDLRARTGRPHWIVVDEAHHLLPTEWDPASVAVSKEATGFLYVTVHPDQVSPHVLSTVDIVLAVGVHPEQSFKRFAAAIEQPAPSMRRTVLEPGEAVVWRRREGESPFRIRTALPKMERKRHRRKYAEGELAPDLSFYFRGPGHKLNLRAQNLMLFVQIAEGVDDETWRYHLRRQDYSDWFRRVIKNDELADDAAVVERETGLDADESRRRIREAIERHYTMPAASPLTAAIEKRQHPG
jgi:hydroxymethylpyrimidine pyrophosphatase-like HAD family hydrolase/energy-coupling factor transporter ATP-binding protein EcfA2